MLISRRVAKNCPTCQRWFSKKPHQTQLHNIHEIQCPFFSFMVERFSGGQFRFKWWKETHTHTHRKQSQEEKCELLALVTAQSDKLPQWKDLTVSSPLRRARSRGTTSHSPGCSPAQEQLQPPSACSTLHLPEWRVCHLLCYDRDKFNEIKCKPMLFFLRDEGLKVFTAGHVKCSTKKTWNG